MHKVQHTDTRIQTHTQTVPFIDIDTVHLSDKQAQMLPLTSCGAKVAQKNGNPPLLGAPFSKTLRYYATAPPKRVVRQWRSGAGGALSGATPSVEFT